jgi:predicted metal-dependent peptidase
MTPKALSRDRLMAARLWAATRFPYLASALFASPVIAAPGIGTIAVDESWRLYADPVLVDEWTAPQLGSVLVHHAGHLLRDHGARARNLGIARDDLQAWTLATDAEINDDFGLEELDCPLGAVLPEHLGCRRGRLAEEYFQAVRVTHRDCECHPACGHCGSGADGLVRPWEATDDERLSPYSGSLLRRQVAEDILNHSRQAGTVPAGLRRWAEQQLRTQVDWRRVLAAEVRRGLADVVGAVDYSYRRPSRRATAVDKVVLPSLRRPVPEVAIVCDTSGSMTEDLLARALAEVEGILHSVGVRAGGVRVLAVDAAVHTARRVTSSRQVELVGGGGTDMGAGIEAAGRARPRPGVIIVLTDGYTPWPPTPLRQSRVIAGLLGAQAPDAPAWVRTVRIDVADGP